MLNTTYEEISDQTQPSQHYAFAFKFSDTQNDTQKNTHNSKAENGQHRISGENTETWSSFRFFDSNECFGLSCCCKVEVVGTSRCNVVACLKAKQQESRW